MLLIENENFIGEEGTFLETEDEPKNLPFTEFLPRGRTMIWVWQTLVTEYNKALLLLSSPLSCSIFPQNV